MVHATERYLTQYLSSSSFGDDASSPCEASLEDALFSPTVTRQGLVPSASTPVSGVAALRSARAALQERYPRGLSIASGDYGLVDVSSLLVTFVATERDDDKAQGEQKAQDAANPADAPLFRGACLLAFSPESKRIERIEDFHCEW